MDAAARLWFRESVGVPAEGCGRWGAAAVNLPQRDGAIGTLSVDFSRWRRWFEFLFDVIIKNVVVSWVGS